MIKFRFIQVGKNWAMTMNDVILTNKKGTIIFSSRTKAIKRFLWESYKWLKGAGDFTISVGVEAKADDFTITVEKEDKIEPDKG